MVGSMQRLGVAHNPQRCIGLDTQPCPGCDGTGLQTSQVLTSAAGAAACRPRELSVGDAHRVLRARGERRRHTITNGVDCDLVSEGSETAKAGFGGCQLIINISFHVGLTPLEG